MEHITLTNLGRVNIIKSTPQEFFTMKHFLEQHGIEARITKEYDGVCEWQIRNVYRDCCYEYPNAIGEVIKQRAKNEMKDCIWSR